MLLANYCDILVIQCTTELFVIGYSIRAVTVEELEAPGSQFMKKRIRVGSVFFFISHISIIIKNSILIEICLLSLEMVFYKIYFYYFRNNIL